MKKTVLTAALLALTFPITLNAIGLGEMTVKSSLDQPFLAEIELVDVGNSPVVGIKVGVADPDNFKQLGLERVAALSLLNFKIEKNNRGKFVIKVQTRERMSDPYMELVVDLTWPGGQLYKAYTVLLDPPGYQLVSTRAQSSPTYYKKATETKSEPGVLDKTVISEVQHNPVSLNDGKKQTTYGPTIANENVWQIAQRYKTSEIILPQVVLAITGANPDAFTERNLNGLKVGVRLTIPATREIAKIPAELATAEVMAHDKAWNEKTPINHVLTPPYTNGQTTNPALQAQSRVQSKSSEIPTIPRFTIQAITPNQNTMPQLIPTAGGNLDSSNQARPVQNGAQNADQNAIIKTELSITTAAVETVRESNALLMEQFHLLQDQNKKLQKQLEQRDKEIKAIRSQMQILIKQRLAIAGQANSSTTDNQSSNFWTLLLLLVVASGGGGFAYWYFKLREKEAKQQPFLSIEPIRTTKQNEPVEPRTTISEMSQTAVRPAEISIQEVVSSPAIKTDKLETKETSDRSVQDKEDGSDDRGVEMETKPKMGDLDLVVQSAEELKDESAQNQLPLDDVNLMAEINKHDVVQQKESKQRQVERSTPDVLEFEPGLYQRLTEQQEQKVQETEATEELDKGIDFVSSSSKEQYRIEKDQLIESGETAKNNNTDKDIDEFTVDDFHTVENESLVTEHHDIDVDAELAQFFADSDKENSVVNDGDLHSNIEELSESDDSKTAAPLKSKAALDTLLALANTYISMDDMESAKASLEEILEHGSDQQKAEAQRLLAQIKNK